MRATSPISSSTRLETPLPGAEPSLVAPAPIEHLLRSVGHTPLVELVFADDLPAGVRLFAKLESCNPGASIKDRPVLRMLSRAHAAGRFKGGRRLLDSSSGNAGIAYAQFGAAFGIGVTLVVPGNASRERLERIRAHGAELVLTDPIEGYDHAVMTSRRLAQDHPERYWYSDQYSNDDNWRAHYETTGHEILEQTQQATGGLPDAFIAGVGTGGTLTGVGRRLRKHAPDVHITAIVPEIFPGIEGLKPLGHPGDFVPEILAEELIDHRIEITIDQAVAMCQRLARRGLFVGPSSGAYVHAALEVASSGRYKTLVTVLSDSGERYGSTGMWETSLDS